jgi:transposase-like protein
MAKAHRGAGIRDQVSHGRGTCPVCKRSGIKVGYEHEVDGAKAMICKQCNATFKNAK